VSIVCSGLGTILTEAVSIVRSGLGTILTEAVSKVRSGLGTILTEAESIVRSGLVQYTNHYTGCSVNCKTSIVAMMN